HDIKFLVYPQQKKVGKEKAEVDKEKQKEVSEEGAKVDKEKQKEVGEEGAEINKGKQKEIVVPSRQESNISASDVNYQDPNIDDTEIIETFANTKIFLQRLLESEEPEDQKEE
ncbi:27885_t:CDS:2, partial [Racocetra persica]